MTASATLEGGPAARTEHAFPGLDGLRMVAATAVVFHHVGFWTGNYTPDLAGRVLSRLDVGVPIFFVLSGFLLSRPLFDAARRGVRPPGTAGYLWRRALRILPAYWLTVIAALWLLPGNDGAGVGTWISHGTLTQIYRNSAISADGLSHMWSLCTEVAFYLVLPFVAAGLVRLSRRSPERPAGILTALGVGGLVGPAWLAWVAGSHPDSGMSVWLPGYTGWFAAGMALALLSVSDPSWRPVRLAAELGSSLPTCWAASGVLFWMATSSIAGPQTLDHPLPGEAVVKSVLYTGVAAFLVLPLVLGDQSTGWVRRALSSPPARFFGEISYALFLVHVVVITGGYALLGWSVFSGSFFIVIIGTLTISLAIATAVYLLVERPLRRWRNLVGRDRRIRTRTSSEATTAPSATSTST